jgi:ABC-2 type transport system ATP-binding protein
MTAKENLELVCKIKGINYSKVQEKLEVVGLIERKDSKFKTFSLGMKQRLAIASALLNDPEILILDEPTNGLDPQGIHQIRDIIRLIASQGTTILLASHLLDEVEKVCSHVLVLRKGEILYTGSVSGMSSSNGIIELQANDTNLLLSTLQKYPKIDAIKNEDGKIIITPKLSIDPSELNKYLADNNVYVTHLVKRNHSLEEQFLELTGK